MCETKFSISDYPFQPTSAINDLDLPYSVDQYSNSCINGHSHGLICFSLFPRDIFICNPFTRNIHRLPPSTLPINALQQTDPFGLSSFPNAIGFGYDSISRDFKVVRVVNYVVPPVIFLPPRVEVYHLGENQWREIKTPINGYAFREGFEMYYEGFYYWWALDQVCPPRRILWRFNMSEEVFDHISVPTEVEEGNGSFNAMGVLDGSVVLFWSDYKYNRSFDIWRMEMNEVGGGVLWSKPFRIGPVLGANVPLEFVSSDQVLMENKEGQLMLYNTKTQHCKHLPLQGCPGLLQAIVFVNSLLSVNGGHH